MTSGTPFPSNLTEVDQLSRPDHYHLDEDDDCFFLGEYTARRGFAFSDTNNLILNLKKTPDRRGKLEWQHKEHAILVAAQALKNSIKKSWLRSATFVPIPPSKARDDPMYDDRMSRLIQAIDLSHPVDCRELVLQTESTEAAHEQDHRPGPDEIRALYALDPNLIDPIPSRIVICDDVLTTGAHFKAMQDTLRDACPDAQIVGCFIARRVPEAIDVEAFFENLDGVDD